MSDDDISTLEGLEVVLDVVVSVAREAGQLVLGGFRQHPEAEQKNSAVDLVTSFDRDSETLVRKRLTESFPSFAVIGEEQGGGRAPIAFYVDPIDGTTNFVHGHPFWCISIGLVANDVPVLGVVIAPALGLEFVGLIAASSTTSGRGRRYAVRRSKMLGREEICVVSKTARFEDAFLATGFPYDRRTSDDNNFDAFTSIKRQCQAIRRCGSAALDLCLVADGTYEGYWEKKLKPWDIAAGVAIVHAAGGRVTNYEGEPCNIENGHAVATNGVIHQALLDALARVKKLPKS